MNIPMLNALVEGYQDRLFDQECLAVHQGYWAAYYQSKRPKPVKTILTKMVTDHERVRKKRQSNTEVVKPEVNVNQFLEREARLKLVRK